VAFTDYQKEQIRQTIIEISSKLNFSFEYFLTPPTRSCLESPLQDMFRANSKVSS
jgi:hypothetical protein